MASDGERLHNNKNQLQLERGGKFLGTLVDILRLGKSGARGSDIGLAERHGSDKPFVDLYVNRIKHQKIEICWPVAEKVYLLFGEDVEYEVHLHHDPFNPQGTVSEVMTRRKNFELRDFNSKNELILRYGYKEDEDKDWLVLVARGKDKPVEGTPQHTVDVYRLNPTVHKLGLVSLKPNIYAQFIPGGEKFSYQELVGE